MPPPQPDASSFHPIWYVTPNKSVAKVACKVDLLAAVLGGTISPSSQVRDDGSNLWTPAGSSALVAPLLAHPGRIKRVRLLFLLVSLALGALMLLPIIGAGFTGFRTVLSFAFVAMILHESYEAAIESIELSLARRILIYLGSVTLAIAGFGVCAAAIELARLRLFPQLEPNSDWLTLALLFAVIPAVMVPMELLWERWKPYRKQNLERAARDNLPIKARTAQVLAKQARIHALFGFERCGRQVMPDGQCYEGKFSRGERDGHGVFSWANGARYEGRWQKGKRHGDGVEILPDGTETPGVWANGQRTGEAT